ncbi:MAG: hypothetical protein FJZ10_06655 [Candidatus Omnitrophica bacterium]|nr:hypothetical protein [Candidatus Omnitrophota bacterium]
MRRNFLLSIFLLLFICYYGSAENINSLKEHFDLAVKHYLSRNYDAALDELRQCLSIDPGSDKANKLLPIVLKRKDDELRSSPKSVSKDDLGLADEYCSWAQSKYFNNDIYGAMDDLHVALKINPNHKKARDLFATITDKIESQRREQEPVTSIGSVIPVNKKHEKIKAFFKNEDLAIALRTISQLLNINIIFPADITGKVNANFTDAKPETVLSTILRSTGYTYFIDGTVVRVVQSNDSTVTNRIFKLKYTSFTEDQIEDIKDVLSDKGRILYEPKSRTLVIADAYSNIHDVEEMVKKMDEARPQVHIDAKVMEVAVTKLANLGVKWDQNMYVKLTGATRPLTFPFDPGVFSSSSELGKYAPLSKPPEEGDISDFPTSESTAFPYTTVDDFTFGSIESGTLQVTLDALTTDGDTNILSNPRLLAIDDEESEILIGTIVPVPTYERNSTTGQMEITGYEDKEVGIILRVTPRIHQDNYVTLAVHPEVSAITGYTGENNEKPIITTREVTTTLRVKDGDTVVIGGLLNEREIDTITKVPFLGDMPLVGFAFKHKSKTKEKTEILIFLTINIPREFKTADLR